MAAGAKSEEESTALQYSELLHRLSAYISRNTFLKPAQADGVPLQEAKALVREQLLDMEGRSHAACEYAKFVAYLRQEPAHE